MKKRHLILVLILFILTVFIVYLFAVNKNKIKTTNENLPAYSRGSLLIGNFSITDSSVKCVNMLPQVNLSWSQSSKATSYSIERAYPSGGDWEVTGETTNLSFTDSTYEPEYDIGNFSYRIGAYDSAENVKYSKTRTVKIVSCPTVGTNPSVIPPVVVTPTPVVTPPVCIAESTTTTCLNKCGAQKNNCGNLVTCIACVVPVTPTPTPTTNTILQWGAYVGDGTNDLVNFESLVGKKVNLYADFEGWSNSFPSALSTKVGAQGKILVIFWEPSFGYDQIVNGSKDAYIKQFALGAKSYAYPIILAPFDEMNLNEEAWGYGINNNTSFKFRTAWQHIHDIFVVNGVANVKFAITYNNDSVPNVIGNKMSDYYPGDSYVDYVGLDGFNFANPWKTFAQIFDSAITEASMFNKPIYILSTGSEAGSQKDEWIIEGLGTTIKNYKNVLGWVWFNQAGSPNWTVNSDTASLTSFKLIIPK